ncbi:hypothetical protein PHYPSEUDO_011793 [Phytophthora pseudosyringae]|uniref:Uncharacterized protein n=1 Tax=Phytophthora pseudosyringae TaxID=221518 RepID=A0A8T1W967_9STRA|nr:hypothetical protein PHYPSEUDO_011793 [Phytophthora pseudosyringae]
MLLVDKLPPPQVSAGRKRKIVLGDDCREKRARCAWTELEYEMVLEEATLLREELELLLFVAADLCRDLSCDAAPVRSSSAALEQIGKLLASPEPLTVPQIRDICQQMLSMMQYLCRVHYNHFACVDMQDQLRECRNRFMLFICKNAAMLGL